MHLMYEPLYGVVKAVIKALLALSFWRDFRNNFVTTKDTINHCATYHKSTVSDHIGTASLPNFPHVTPNQQTRLHRMIYVFRLCNQFLVLLLSLQPATSPTSFGVIGWTRTAGTPAFIYTRLRNQSRLAPSGFSTQETYAAFLILQICRGVG